MSTSSVSDKNQAGEIASILILASLFTMVVGTLVGSNTIVKNKVNKLFSKAQTNCTYESKAQIRINGLVARDLSGFEYESKQYPNGNDFQPKRGSFPENPLRPGDMEVRWTPNPLPNNYVERNSQTELFLPPTSNYRIKSFFCSGRSTINTGFDPCLQVRRETNNPKVIRNIPLLCGTSVEYGWELETVSAPTPTPTTSVGSPSASPSVPPLCYFKSNISIVDENGAVLKKSQLSDSTKWKVTNSKGQESQFGTLTGNTTDLVWKNDRITPPPVPNPDNLTASAFIHSLPPTTNELTNLTLSLGDDYSITERKITRHCQTEFDDLNGRRLGCRSINNQGQPQGNYLGVVNGGDPKVIPSLSVQCNMEVDAQWKVKKIETGSLQVQVQLSAGDLTKNIPFTTRKVPSLLNPRGSEKGDDFNPYDGRSSVKISGTDQNGIPFSRTTIITTPYQTIPKLPIGTYDISYIFPEGVMATRDKNNEKTQVYRINSPPIDGNKVTIQKDQTYNYRIIYNINSGACKAVRNPSSCTSCNGNSMDDINNPAWPHPNGKSLCCPDSKDRSKFSCSDNFDNRCTPGTFWFGNCSHYDSTSQKSCGKSEKGRYTCIRQENGETYWGDFTCLADNSCGLPPTSTPRPRPTRATVPTIPPSQPPIICGPVSNNTNEQNLDSTITNDDSPQINGSKCELCCQNNDDCIMPIGTERYKGSCQTDQSSKCSNQKSCVFLSCPISKQNTKGQCDVACCDPKNGTADCRSGEACIIGNGNCGGGSSCCREGKVSVDNKCDASCCDADDDCGTGEKCAMSSQKCKSGSACVKVSEPKFPIDVSVENVSKTLIWAYIKINKCVNNTDTVCGQNVEYKKVDFNGAKIRIDNLFRVPSGIYHISITDIEGNDITKASTFQLIKPVYAKPFPQARNGGCSGTVETDKDGNDTCKVNDAGMYDVIVCDDEAGECEDLPTPTPEPPIIVPPSGDGIWPQRRAEDRSGDFCSPSVMESVIIKAVGNHPDRPSIDHLKLRAKVAACICKHESVNGNRNALNESCRTGGSDYAPGLFQHNIKPGGTAKNRCREGKEMLTNNSQNECVFIDEPSGQSAGESSRLLHQCTEYLWEPENSYNEALEQSGLFCQWGNWSTARLAPECRDIIIDELQPDGWGCGF